MSLDRKTLTFEQAEGVAPLPRQMRRDEVSPQLRALLWAVIPEKLKKASVYPGYGYDAYLDGGWGTVLYHHHVLRLHRMADEFDRDPATQIEFVKSIIQHGSYTEVFGFLEYVLRHDTCPEDLAESLSNVLELCHSAFRLVDDDTFMPVASEEEKEALDQAFSDLAAAGLKGPRR